MHGQTKQETDRRPYLTHHASLRRRRRRPRPPVTIRPCQVYRARSCPDRGESVTYIHADRDDSVTTRPPFSRASFGRAGAR
jgi:hypothetical protein